MMTGARATSLPYRDPFSEAERLAIEDAIKIGLEKVRGSGVLDCRAADEIHFTEHLVTELNSMLDSFEVPGFSAAWLETIPKGGELRSFNGTHIEKRPDMVFRRQGVHPGVKNRQYCGLFVECKIVDATRTMDDYCGDGISRFVKGEYAWAMTIGMLLGYARDAYELPRQLDKHLKQLGARYQTIGPCQRTGTAIYSTVHDRIWRYPSGGKPGKITLRHLWIKVA